MEKEDFKWKLGRIFYDLAEGKIGVLDAYERYDAIENEKVVLPQADVIGRFSSKSKIEAIAEVVYPKDKRKDIDGDWYDANTQERNGFVTGCMVILQQCGVDLHGL